MELPFSKALHLKTFFLVLILIPKDLVFLVHFLEDLILTSAHQIIDVGIGSAILVNWKAGFLTLEHQILDVGIGSTILVQWKAGF